MLNPVTFRISDFSVSTLACGRDTQHDTSGRCTQNSGVSFTVVTHLFGTATSQGTGSLGALGAHTPCGPAAASCVCLRRVVNTVRFCVPLRNSRFAEADLRGASTGREVAHRLAYPPRGRGVNAVPRPAPLTEQGCSRTLAKTWPRVEVESGQKRDGTAYGICGR